MEYAIDFFKNMTNNLTKGLNVCTLAKVQSFDDVKMTADVIPLMMSQSPQGEYIRMSPLLSVPVSFLFAGGFYVRPPLEEGDLVIVLFADSDIDKVLMSGDEETPNTNRQHDRSDAMIIGMWKKFDEELPVLEEDQGNLVISNIENNFSISFGKDGSIDISSSENIFIRSDKTVRITGSQHSSVW